MSDLPGGCRFLRMANIAARNPDHLFRRSKTEENGPTTLRVAQDSSQPYRIPPLLL